MSDLASEVEGGTNDLSMDLGLDEAFDFDSALREKGVDREDPAIDTDEGSTTDEPSAGPERDPDTGRFVARDDTGAGEETDDDDDGADEGEGDEGEEPESDLILGKFKDPDALAQSYTHLERRNGEMANELGELRQRLDALEKGGHAPAQQEGIPITDDVVNAVDEAFEADPQRTALWALQNDPSGMLYERVMDRWYDRDQGGNPKDAARFEQSMALMNHEQDLLERIAPTIERTEKETRDHAVITAWGSVRQRHTDFKDVVPAMREALEEREALARDIMTTVDQTEREQLIENLYYIAKGVQADAVAAGKTAAAKEETESSRAAKREAAVASGKQGRGTRGSGGSSDKVAAFKEDILKRGNATDISSGWSS